MTSAALLGAFIDAAFAPAPVPDRMELEAIIAGKLAQEIAAGIDQPVEHVWAEMTRLPDAMLPLLESPSGWVALALHIETRFGVEAGIRKPTVH